MKRKLLPWLFRRVDGFLYSCSANAHYYKHYGVPDEKLFFCPCAVDNEFWQEQAERFKPRKRELKEQYGIGVDSPVALFVGKLIDRKRPQDLLRAFEGVYRNYNASLVFVGDGTLRGELEREVKERGLERVYFLGFKNQTELGPCYGMADVFVLPSDYDPSPKALNEAMNFGLPVIVTDRVGTAPDLVHHGVNGFIYPVGDVGALRRHLSELLEDSGRREHMGRRSLEIVSRWSFEEDVRGILKALDYVCSRRGSRDGRN
jgi:glycosyltransferase involved in cell wall biosynthesis